MTEKFKDHSESDSAETLFHDLATPLLIAKMKAGLLASYLPQLIKSLAESPELRHLLPEDNKVVAALISAPETMVSNLDVVQKKINLLSTSVLHHADNFAACRSGDNADESVQDENTDASSSALVKTAAIKTILLVDDESIHRDIGEMVLAPYYQVDFAENGLEAIRKCEQKQYDLILMDLHMPKMNGEQATVALRTRVNDETIIIGLTSLPPSAYQTELLTRGFTAFLKKPLTMKALENVLQTHFHQA